MRNDQRNPLLRTRDGRALLLTQAAHALAQGMMTVIIPWLILESGGSLSQATIGFAITFVPFLLLAVPASAQTTQADRPQVEREVMAVLDAFFDAFNHQDAKAEERTYHFPHYRLASGQMAVYDAPGAATESWMNNTYRTLRGTGWDHTAWTRRRIIHMSDSKVHVDTEFTRYRKDGSALGRFESLYIVTKEEGRWGIKMRSSFETLIK